MSYYDQIIDTPLRAARIAKQLSQLQVAAHLHLKNNTMISRWEKQHAYPCLEHALRLSSLYEVPAEILFSYILRVPDNTSATIE
ncbi:MAG: helix-turn-helix transcriptional regulator [Candidatus Paceibacterota bacterium]